MAKRTYGTGALYEKHGGYYGRWRTGDGRQLNRRIGPMRLVGGRGGLTRAQAERAFHRLQEEENRRPRPAAEHGRTTVNAAAESLRRQRELEGARKSYLQGLESMQRVNISDAFGELALSKVTTAHVESLAGSMMRRDLAPKTVRNVIAFLHSIFEHAISKGWCAENPVRRAARPKRRRAGDAAPDLQFLSVVELEAVIRAIPDEVVNREPAPTRRGRSGPAPPPPPDVLGPVLRVLILAAAMTGVRQSELLGLRWKHVDWTAQRLRVRNAWVRGEHSEEGKSDLSTRRSVPIADRLARELDHWSRRTPYTAPRRPRLRPSSERQAAGPHQGHTALQASVPERRSDTDPLPRPPPHLRDPARGFRHTAPDHPGVPGARDAKTTQIYSHYAPSTREVEIVNTAFAAEPAHGEQFGEQTEAN